MLLAKKWILGQKTAFLARNSAFFYATPMKPPFFWLRRTRLIWIISPRYPEVTLDTFGFPVGGRLAARRAVSWHLLPKWPFLSPKVLFLGLKLFFVAILQIFCYHHDWALKRQCFRIYHNAGQATGGVKGPFF